VAVFFTAILPLGDTDLCSESLDDARGQGSNLDQRCEGDNYENILLVSLLLMLVSPSYAPLASQKVRQLWYWIKWSRSRPDSGQTATPDTAPGAGNDPAKQKLPKECR